MSKQTMVAALLEHAEIYWDHKTGKACCYGCDAMLCEKTESMEEQGLKLVEHQADEMLSAGLGLTRPAEADAWEVRKR